MDTYKKGFGVIGPVVFFILIMLATLVFFRREKVVAGQVVDCDSGEPVSEVLVAVNQHGWGFVDRSLVWDKSYVTAGKSGENGSFLIGFKVGSSANITTTAEGYMKAQQYEIPSRNVVIKIRKGTEPPGQVTHNCRLTEECISCTLENNVQVCKNVCVE
jgi:hypothetical protein